MSLELTPETLAFTNAITAEIARLSKLSPSEIFLYAKPNADFGIHAAYSCHFYADWDMNCIGIFPHRIQAENFIGPISVRNPGPYLVLSIYGGHINIKQLRQVAAISVPA